LFGGYGLALAALALVVFGGYDSYPFKLLFEDETLTGSRIIFDELSKIMEYYGSVTFSSCFG